MYSKKNAESANYMCLERIKNGAIDVGELRVCYVCERGQRGKLKSTFSAINSHIDGAMVLLNSPVVFMA